MGIESHPTRKRLRLEFHDYKCGWYFITLCTAKRAATLGEIDSGVVRLSPLGELASRCWAELPSMAPSAILDEFTFMPNHFHAILIMDQGGWAGTRMSTLSSVVGAFKSRVSRLAGQTGIIAATDVWQRGFHDRVIRGERELFTFRRYIRENGLATVLPPRIKHR